MQLYPGAEAVWSINDWGIVGRGGALSSLQLAAAVGQSSNASLFTGFFGPGPATQNVTSNPGTVPLPRTTALNASAQLGLLDNHLRVQPIYYRHYTAHASVAQLDVLPFAPGTGSAVLFTRDVALLNQGIELNINYVYTSDRKTFVSVTFAAAHNQQTVQGIGGSQPVPGLAVGEAARPYFGYQRQGLDASGQLQYRDQNGDGRVNSLDASYFGRGLPSWLLNLSEELTVGRFTLQTQFDALLGYQLLGPALARLNYPDATSNGSQRLLSRWTTAQPSTAIPAAPRSTTTRRPRRPATCA